jgi:hypothetical protein
MQAYYEMTDVDCRKKDAETVLCEDSMCEDTTEFALGLAEVTGDVTCSIVGSIFYALRMRQYLGTHNYTIAIAAYIAAAGTLKTVAAPNLSRLVRRTQELDGGYKASQV